MNAEDTEDKGLCVERILDPGYEAEAEDIARRVNPANVAGRGPRDRLALLSGKRWLPGQKLRIRFLDGSALMQENVIRAVLPWTKHANLHFDFCDDPKAEIRISFFADGASWSALGTDALLEKMYPAYQPTMNFGWLREHSPEQEYARVALHEFGHALGCVHEHQSPGMNLVWNEEAVYARYAGPPGYWSKERIYRNVIQRHEEEQAQFTTFDPKSIMMYPIPGALLASGVSIPGNAELSPRDIAFIRVHYPPNA